MSKKLFWPPSGFLADVGELPDEAAALLPALASYVVVWPEEERTARAGALLCTLARAAGLHGAVPLSKTLGDVDSALRWCLRILLVSYGSEAEASRAFVEAVDRTTGLAQYPTDTPSRPSPYAHPRPSSTGPSPPPPPIFDQDQRAPRRDTSPSPPAPGPPEPLPYERDSPSYQGDPRASSLDALVARLDAAHQPVCVQVGGIRYCWPSGLKEAAELKAAAMAVQAALALGAHRPVPAEVAFAATLMPREAAEVYLAEERACEEGIGWAVPRATMSLLRLARLVAPTAEVTEWTAMQKGIPFSCPGTSIVCTVKKETRPVPRPDPAPAAATRRCRQCDRVVPPHITWKDHQASGHCKRKN